MIQLEKVLSSDQLPSLPQVALRIIQLTQQPDLDFDQLVSTVKTDQAIAGKILKTANSALFGLRRRVSSIEAGVPVLGTTLIRTLALSFTLTRHQSPSDEVSRFYQSLWRSSLTQAVAAETLALEIDDADSNVFFIGGLLQDVGVLALLRTHPEQYIAEILRLDKKVNRVSAEHERCGFTHVDVSVELCRRWGLEDELVQAISRHHQAGFKRVGRNTSSLELALKAAAQCADYLEALRAGCSDDLKEFERFLDNHFPLADSVDEFLDEVSTRVGEIATLLSVDIGPMPPLEELLGDAKSALEDIAFQSHLRAVASQQKAERATIKLKRVEAQGQRLRRCTYRDPLTGAYNRRFMSDVLAPELERCDEEGTCLGFLFLDVDKFKALNDAFGHPMGDQALKAVVRILHESVRESDLVIRYGGDEFLVVLIDITDAELRRISERICGRTSEIRLREKRHFRISTSVGAVLYAPRRDARLDTDSVIRKVDEAMYQAKRLGGNRVQLQHLTGRCVNATNGQPVPQRP